MKFKKLEVFGFKSFADKLEVKFSDGVTAIVGPNGCGKSNVADSIRWVLGEQSAKLLRGSSMQDVIFNGTEKRKSLSFCEVSLYFDNANRQLFPNLEYEEVVISRKLYRSGESEYAINKSPCRLKDITDLLRDGGMGREGYSIIGQGRIDELLSAKPEDRRTIFEEAAGISKFKARKVDAERKLARTRDNITRINDILAEKSRILEPLTRQSEAARKWLDYRDKLKTLEINTYIHQYESANDAKAVINDRLNGVNEEIALREHECDAATSAYNEAADKLSGIDRDIDAQREELLTLTVGMEKQAGEVRLLSERMGNLTDKADELKKENDEAGREYLKIVDLVERGGIERQSLEKEIAAVDAANAKINDRYLEVVESLTEGEGEIESNHKAVIEAMDRLADIRSNMSRLLAERDGLKEQVAQLNERIGFMRASLTGYEATESELRGEVETLSRERGDRTAELDRLYEKNNENIANLNRLERELEGLNADYYMVKSRHKMLSEIREAYDGYANSVRNLLSAAKTDRAVADRIEGVVADLITVDAKYETAIEMALGGALQNVVTETEEEVKYLIAYLKNKRFGRVTFLPVSAAKPRSIDREYREARFAGAIGVAVDLVQFDKKYDGVMRALLGGTMVVDNVDNAVAVAKKTGYAFRIVTLDGDVINPQGAITGGSKKADVNNLLSRERELDAADAKLKKTETAIKEKTAERDAIKNEQQSLGDKLKAARERMHEADIAYAAKSEAMNAAVEQLNERKGTLSAAENEAAEKQARIDAIERDINSVGELEELINSKKQSVSDVSEEKRAQFEALRRDRDALHEQLTAGRVKATELTAQLNALTADTERLRANAAAITEKIERNNVVIEENAAAARALNAQIKAITEGSGSDDDARVKALRASLGDLDAFKQRLTANRTELDNKRIALMNELQKLHENANKERMLLLKVDTDIEQMQQRVQEEYNLEYADCLPFKEENFDVERGIAESNKLKRQMNALGHVNLDSIEQCKEIYNSYHEMDVQREDLVKAEEDLVRIIKELSTEMLTRFTDQFEQIRANFTKIFTELFDGGTADLVLLESENPLEAGIDIVAQPPQKKLQSISLLSGGERALTAIAILFAILRLKPMPFCVLDEIEAALDDANAGRFAKYLRRFSEETQFIVITHRKPTMELADNLYGVTMEEKGVSKIVSVKLSDAIRAAQPAESA